MSTFVSRVGFLTIDPRGAIKRSGIERDGSGDLKCWGLLPRMDADFGLGGTPDEKMGRSMR